MKSKSISELPIVTYRERKGLKYYTYLPANNGIVEIKHPVFETAQAIFNLAILCGFTDFDHKNIPRGVWSWGGAYYVFILATEEEVNVLYKIITETLFNNNENKTTTKTGNAGSKISS